MKRLKKKSNVEKTFTPGKFVASENGSVYHTPKCDWAKRISNKNKVWFNDKQEARKKGYRQHDCVKNL